MNPREQHFNHLLELLKLEREEDLRQYQELVQNRPLKKRIETGSTWYPIALNKSYIGLGEKIVLEIDNLRKDIRSNPPFQVGSIVSVFGTLSDQEVGRASGVVARFKKHGMRIVLGTEQFPDWLFHAKLGVDLGFNDRTYREMEYAVNQVLGAKRDSRLYELSNILLTEDKPEFYQWKVNFRDPNLNLSQNQALQNALEARDVAIIHGPPGTGKTTTLVHLIHEVSKRENQVLVCAPSNTAVDLLTLRCSEMGLAVLRLGNPARVEERLLNLTLDGSIAEHSDFPSLRKLRAEAENIRTQALKHKRKYGAKEAERRRAMLKEAREFKKLAHQLEDYITHQVLSRTQVIATTLTGSAHSLLKDKHFHTVFIDEAAQALEPACWIPVLKSDRVIMAGDHCQLPPTVKSTQAEKKGLGRTLFEQIIDKKEVSVMLKQQYRMHQQIMGFSGKTFYDDQLEADASVANRVIGPNFPPLEFVDTAGCGFDEQRDPQTQSVSNPDEAQLLLRHLATLLIQVQQEVPLLIEQRISIAIIAPYKQQVRTLREQLHNSPLLSDFLPLISINTVDGFQGQERDIVYLSLTRSNRKGEIGFLRDIRRTNVALTRAKQKLVVIGDSATLAKHPFYSDFFDYAEELDAYRTAWEWAE
ncbi:MAG: AAA domain-containing protein [Bacteroidota bacterium]